MIELANDAKASPKGWRATGRGETRKTAPAAKSSGRSGPTWPFLSRYAARPAQQAMRKPAANDSGS